MRLSLNLATIMLLVKVFNNEDGNQDCNSLKWIYKIEKKFHIPRFINNMLTLSRVNKGMICPKLIK